MQARLKVLTHPALLVIDEIGYLPISRTGAMLFFQLIDATVRAGLDRADSSEGFEDWGDVVGDDVMAAALDRLVLHCHRMTIRGTATACGSTRNSVE